MKLLIEALRIWRPPTKRVASKHESSVQRSGGSNLSTRPATNLIPDERELTSLLSIREEGNSPSPMPSNVQETQEKSETPVELDHSSEHQLPDSRSQHSIEAEQNSSDNNEDVDSLRSNAGSRQSLLKYSEDIAKD